MGGVDAATAGAKEAAATEIWVNEKHSGRHLLLEQTALTPEAFLGKPTPPCILKGFDFSFTCVSMMGIHGRANPMGAVVERNWGAKCAWSVRVSEMAVGELGSNTRRAGHFGPQLL